MKIRKAYPDNMVIPNRLCPECDKAGRSAVELIVKTNRLTEGQFLGCPNYPLCTYTEGLTEDLRMRLDGQPAMF